MRLALGAVQFGLTYGISNTTGSVPSAEVARILSFAAEQGIDTLDTASAYGDSELVLGALDTRHFRVISKLPPDIPSGVSMADWVTQSIRDSLNRLNRDHLHAIMLHRSSQLFLDRGDEIYKTLQELKSEGLFTQLGVSVYSPDELEKLFEYFDFDLVQAPLSIVDRRLVSSGWMAKLAGMGVELHVRSVFLQGLLLMREGERPVIFDHWNTLWSDWHAWLNQMQMSATEACIRYVLSHPEVERVVVGVQNCEQLRQLTLNAAKGDLLPPDYLCNDSEDLLNPARWSLLR
jgi:aryl-alcohol dehydrogenase-like predicted oxidoreductase